MVSVSANVPAAIGITSITTKIIALPVVIGKDVHIFADILKTSTVLSASTVLRLVVLRMSNKIVEQVIHLKIKLEIVGLFVATLSLTKGSSSLQLCLEKRADKQSNLTFNIAVLVALNLFAGQRLLVISFIRGSDKIFLKVGALHRIRWLPHVQLAGHGQAARLHRREVTLGHRCVDHLRDRRVVLMKVMMVCPRDKARCAATFLMATLLLYHLLILCFH